MTRGLSFLLMALTIPLGRAEPLWVYFGTGAEAIYVARFDSETGELGDPFAAAEIGRPNFLEIHPAGDRLYAAVRVAGPDGEGVGSAAAFRIDRATGELTLLNTASTRGAGPCHVSVDKTGRLLATANYGGGSVTAFRIEPDGRLSEASAFHQHQGSSVHPERQQGPHAHSVNFTPDNRFLVAADLGLDRLLLYGVETASGGLTPRETANARTAPGAGPRHFTFHPSGRFGYVINELASTVTAFVYDAERGALEEIQTATTLPDGFSGENHTAEVRAHPSGKFLYGSNRGHDSIAIFRVNPENGRLTPIGHQPSGGKTPRNFNLDPSGRFLLAANQGSDNIVVFRVDGESGDLVPTGRSVTVPQPMCVRFAKAD